MREQLFDRDSFVSLVHFPFQLRKDFANGRVPAQSAFLDEHRCQCRRHGFGTGTDVELVVGRDKSWIAALPNAHRRAITDFPVFHHHDGQRGEIVFLADDFKRLSRVRRERP